MSGTTLTTSGELRRMARAVLRATPLALLTAAVVTFAVVALLDDEVAWEAEAALTTPAPTSLGRLTLETGTALSRAHAAAVQLDRMDPAALGVPNADLDSHVIEDTEIVVVRGRAGSADEAVAVVDNAIAALVGSIGSARIQQVDQFLQQLEAERQSLLESLGALPRPTAATADDPQRDALQRRLETVTTDYADLQTAREQLNTPIQLLDDSVPAVESSTNRLLRGGLLGVACALAVLSLAAAASQLRSRIEDVDDVHDEVGSGLAVREISASRRGQADPAQTAEMAAAWYAVRRHQPTVATVAVVTLDDAYAGQLVGVLLAGAVAQEVDAVLAGVEPTSTAPQAVLAVGGAGSVRQERFSPERDGTTEQWLRRLEKSGEAVIVVAPDDQAQALLVARQADAVVLVVRRGTPSRSLGRAVGLLTDAGVTPAAIVLLHQRRARPW